MTQDDERWKPIPDFPGYEVSDQGRVRSYRLLVTGNRKGAGWVISDSPQRDLRQAITPDGYPFVCLQDDHGNQTVRRIHNLVMMAFVGPCPIGNEVCHGDGDRDNNTLQNLRYDTHSANMRETKRAKP